MHETKVSFTLFCAVAMSCVRLCIIPLKIVHCSQVQQTATVLKLNDITGFLLELGVIKEHGIDENRNSILVFQHPEKGFLGKSYNVEHLKFLLLLLYV